MDSPEGPPWSRAETGTGVCCPRPFCCLFGHRRPGSARGVDVSRGGVSWTIGAICFEAPHACPPCCPLTDVSRDRAADGKQTRGRRERRATATSRGGLAKHSVQDVRKQCMEGVSCPVKQKYRKTSFMQFILIY